MIEKAIRIVLVLALGSILTGALLAINNYTQPIIDRNLEVKVRKSVLDAMEIPYQQDNVAQIFSRNIRSETKNNQKYYISKSEAVAFEIKGAGLWAPITAILALEPDLETIKGISIVEQAETPGLGGRIEEKQFLNGFIGKKFATRIEIVASGKADSINEVDGITGATMTGNALEKMINEEYKRYLPVLGGK